MNETRAVLGVNRSFTERSWIARDLHHLDTHAISRDIGVPEIVARILVGRGVKPEQAIAYLTPTLKSDLPNPSCLIDMDKAAARLADAILSHEKIAVFGDYDVDGATSSAVFKRYFNALGRDITIYIPDRIREGYGPNSAALKMLADTGHKIIVTVDCGIAAHAPLADAKELGLDVIVVDHHLSTGVLPQAFAIVNPNRPDDISGQGMLAAVGVSFLVLVALNRALRAVGGFDRLGVQEPDPRAFLDIVALGTIADVVPLTGVNRALVRAGLKVLETAPKPGLDALMTASGMPAGPDRRPGVYHLGYVLGPRVNAGGRVGRSDLGAQLLAGNDPIEAARMAEELNHFNRERQAVEALVLEAAIAQAASAPEQPLVLVSGEGWHPGVIGIVAGRLKERFQKPAMVIAFEGGFGKGSGRSIPGINLGRIVQEAAERGLLLAGGGHAMAAGLSVHSDKMDALSTFLHDRVALASGNEPNAELVLDGTIGVSGATADLWRAMDQAGPYGAGNPEPMIAVAAARLIKADIVGRNHVRCLFAAPDGTRLGAIAFRAIETALGRNLLNNVGKNLHLAGHLRLDFWQGRERVQLQIEDGAFIEGETRQ
jgi:single-stranded-DNA-specific exonuclease